MCIYIYTFLCIRCTYVYNVHMKIISYHIHNIYIIANQGPRVSSPWKVSLVETSLVEALEDYTNGTGDSVIDQVSETPQLETLNPSEALNSAAMPFGST